MRRFVCFFGLVAAFGCGSAPSPPPTFVLAYQPVNAESVPVLPASFGIARVQASTVYARRSVMWREGNQLGYYTTGAWSDIPQNLIADSLERQAREQGGFAEVRRVAAGYGEPLDVVVRSRIVAFETQIAGADKHARIALHVVLTNGSGDYVLWEGEVAHAIPVRGDDMDGMLGAFTEAQHFVNADVISTARAVIEDGRFDRSLEPR